MPSMATRKQNNEIRVTGLSLETDTYTKKATGSSDRFELPKEYSPCDGACLGLMQKQSRVSIKIAGLGDFSTTLAFKQVPGNVKELYIITDAKKTDTKKRGEPGCQ